MTSGRTTGRGRDENPAAFRLYVAGNAPNSLLAVDNFKAIARDYFGDYELEIIDILRDPMRAITDGVLITPTLLRLTPPTVRIIGNLSDMPTVIVALGLTQKS